MVPRISGLRYAVLASSKLRPQAGQIRRWLSGLLVPVFVVGLLLISPQPSEAARGGRIGGGSFRAPSMPRGGGYSRSYGGGGYGERRPFVARDRKGPSNDIVRVYTSLISAYGKGGQWENCLLYTSPSPRD